MVRKFCLLRNVLDRGVFLEKIPTEINEILTGHVEAKHVLVRGKGQSVFVFDFVIYDTRHNLISVKNHLVCEKPALAADDFPLTEVLAGLAYDNGLQQAVFFDAGRKLVQAFAYVLLANLKPLNHEVPDTEFAVISYAGWCLFRGGFRWLLAFHLRHNNPFLSALITCAHLLPSVSRDRTWNR